MSEEQTKFASLDGKNVVVTGASSGIGKAIALEMARAGGSVVVHYSTSKRAADEVVNEINAFGGTATSLQATFGVEDCGSFAELAWRQFGSVDVLVNNAGVDLLTGDAANLEFHEKLQRLFDVDVSTTIHLTRQFGELMTQNGGGVILNIGWDQADRGMEGESAELFSASKNAVMGFTRSAALSLAPDVRVNCIAPGWIRTAWGDQASEEWQQRVLRETPLQRWGEPEDIARLARFLVSPDASYLTGQVVNANGGAIR